MRLHVGERIIRFTAEIDALKTLLPICMYCKNIRNDSNYWQSVESYMRESTGSDFTHGICPDCYEKEVGPLMKKMES